MNFANIKNLICVIMFCTSVAQAQLKSTPQPLKIEGMEIEHFDFGFGLRTSITRSSLIETHVSYQFSGEIDEIRVYRIPQMTLMMRELVTASSRLSEYFDDNEILWRRITRESQNAKRGLFSKIVTHMDANGKIIQESRKLQGPFSRDRSKLSSCSISLLGNLPLITDVQSILYPDSTDEFNISFNGCNFESKSNLRPIANEALRDGLRCLLRQGGGRAQRDAQLLYNNLVNNTFAINCEPIQDPPYQPGTPPNERPRAVDGFAYDCPQDAPSGSTSEGSWPGMTLNSNKILPMIPAASSTSPPSISLPRLIFHEALHSVGHTHGQSPEVVRACERCCFPSGLSNREERDVCALCAASDNAAAIPAYTAEFLKYFEQLGFSDRSNQFAIEEALANAVSMTKPFLKNKPDYFQTAAEELAKDVCGSPIPEDANSYLEDCQETSFNNPRKNKLFQMIIILSEIDKKIRGNGVSRSPIVRLAPELSGGDEQILGNYLALRLTGTNHNTAKQSQGTLVESTSRSLDLMNDIFIE